MPDNDAPPPDIAAKQARRGELCQRMLGRTLTPAEDAELAAIDRVLDAYLAAVAPLPALPGDATPPDGWQPIETAPRDGTYVLLYLPNKYGWEYSVGRYCSDEAARSPRPFWIRSDWAMGDSRRHTPTHWKPLTPPEEPR